MSLSDIKGQKIAVKSLRRSLTTGNIAHTYLFYGPEGVGRQFAAREFAKSLNCEKASKDACDVCSSCIRIAQNKHPDILWIYPVGKSRVIKIEQVRQLQNFMAWRPYEGRVKVGIIADAHKLRLESGNALLKSLEEPPNNSVFIMITDQPELLLSTIKSRSRGVQFFGLSDDLIKEILEKKIRIPSEDADRLSRLSMGSIETALSFRDENMFNQRKIILDILYGKPDWTMKDIMKKIEAIQDILDEFKENLVAQLKKTNSETTEEDMDEDAFVAGEYRKRIEDILRLIANWYRDIMIYKTNNNAAVFNKDYIEIIKSCGARFDADELLEKMRIIDDARYALSRQINLKLILQVLFVKLNLIPDRCSTS